MRSMGPTSGRKQNESERAEPRRGRRLEHRDRRSVDAEPRPAERGGDVLHGGASRTPRSPSWSTPRSATASTSGRSTSSTPAISNNELVAPPAGAVGRGDAFVLASPRRPRRSILSNDSFQEFHAELRVAVRRGPTRSVASPCRTSDGCSSTASPVRGPVSRKAVAGREAAGGPQRGADGGRQPIASRAAGAGPTRRASKAADRADAGADDAATRPGERRPRDGRAAAVGAAAGTARRRRGQRADAVPRVRASTIRSARASTASSTAYSSHGAYMAIGRRRSGYIPLRLMSDPPPPSARKVMQIGEAVTLVVVSFAAARRSIDCAVPNMASVVEPQDGEAVAAEAAGAAAPVGQEGRRRGRPTAKKVGGVAGEEAARRRPRRPPSQRAAKKAARAVRQEGGGGVEGAGTTGESCTKAGPAGHDEPPAKNRRRRRRRQRGAAKAAPRARAGARPCPPTRSSRPRRGRRRRGPRTAGAAPGPSPSRHAAKQQPTAAAGSRPATQVRRRRASRGDAVGPRRRWPTRDPVGDLERQLVEGSPCPVSSSGSPRSSPTSCACRRRRSPTTRSRR